MSQDFKPRESKYLNNEYLAQIMLIIPCIDTQSLDVLVLGPLGKESSVRLLSHGACEQDAHMSQHLCSGMVCIIMSSLEDDIHVYMVVATNTYHGPCSDTALCNLWGIEIGLQLRLPRNSVSCFCVFNTALLRSCWLLLLFLFRSV